MADDMPFVTAVRFPSDEASAGCFVRAHWGWMLRLSRSYLHDSALAEDAVQNAFIKIFSRRHQFEGRSGIRSWMRRIVVNEALMILRKRRSLNEDSSIDPLQPGLDPNGCGMTLGWSCPPCGEQLLLKHEMRSVVSGAIARLPDDYRRVILLRDIEERTTAEVAEVLGIAEGNVKVRLHRARTALKTLLEPALRGAKDPTD